MLVLNGQRYQILLPMKMAETVKKDQVKQKSTMFDEGLVVSSGFIDKPRMQ